MENNIQLPLKQIGIAEDTIMYLQQPYDVTFDITLLELNVCEDNNTIIPISSITSFETTYAYSFDGSNFSTFVPKTDFVISNIVSQQAEVYIAIRFKKIQDSDFAKTIYQPNNVDQTHKYFTIESVVYNQILIEPIQDETVLKFETIYDLVNEFPRWNFYDNQHVAVNRWLAQCNAIAEMYGHECIYFKTEPIEISHTLKNNVVRNVISIKKLHIQFPNNEFPQDRNVYSDWDMPLQDDIVINIVIDKFQKAFGAKTIPVDKDYLYFPLINKLFRVSFTQPKTGFMGKIAWWECFLSKFEDDDCVSIDQELKDIMTGIPDFDEAIDSIETNSNIGTELFNEIVKYKADTINSEEKLAEKNYEEKKLPTQNFSNKLVDSNFNISLKETEAQREFYNKRLAIVSVNPDESAFPINMYDNSTVTKRVVAMQYSLKQYTLKNKFRTRVTSELVFSYDFVLLNNFVGEVFDIMTSEILSVFTIRNNRNKLEIVDNRNGKVFQTNFIFILAELYNVNIIYSSALKQFSIKVFGLENKEKTLAWQNIYINEDITLVENFEINTIQLFGGNFYSSNITVEIEKNQIMKDFVNPLLLMNNFE